jgi:ABC-2 type transport system permease protein
MNSMKQASVLTGALRYEFRMQIRRRALWITICLLGLLVAVIMSRYPGMSDLLAHLDKYPLLPTLVQWTSNLNRLLPIGVGIMLADRLPRDRSTRVDELFHSMPGTLSARLIGKYFGSLLATLMPVLLLYGIGVGVIAWQTHTVMVLPLALVTFSGIMLPGFLFVAAFSFASTAILWVPLYQFLFICYWFWGNELSPHTGIPTISGTILTPVGKYAVQGFFGVDTFINATPVQATESVLLLVSLAAFMLFGLWCYLKWENSHQ